jgi:protein SCO1/2
MVKGLTLRSLPVLVSAFAVAFLVTVMVGAFSDTSAMLGRAVAPAAQSSSATLAGDLPDVSIETADGRHTSFAATGDHVRIATMLYSHCPGVCPMTIEALRGIERQLTAEQQAGLSFVLLSLDPTRDSPQSLRSLARERGITSSRWLLGRTSASDARAFASAAHIQYRFLSDGSIDHSSTLVLVDAQGRVLARAGDSGETAEFVTAVRRALDQH